jgi:hypothetical protein
MTRVSAAVLTAWSAGGDALPPEPRQAPPAAQSPEDHHPAATAAAGAPATGRQRIAELAAEFDRQGPDLEPPF